MIIDNGKIVTFHYVLKNESGDILDKSKDEPLSFVFGSGQIIAGLEKALLGKQKGEAFDVEISAKDAYGERREDLVNVVPLSAIQGVDKVEEGMQFQGQSPENESFVVTVLSVSGEQVTLDANHPLAGQALFFDIQIIDVAEAAS